MKADEQKIKIVRIIARLNIGGPAIQAIMLTECLPADEFTSFLITGNIGEDEGDMLPYARKKNVHPIIFPELGREISSLKDIVVFFKLVKFFRTIRPHIVHTHTAKAGTLGRLAAFVARVPITVHTFHGHVFAGYFNWVKTKLFILIERFLARLSDRILVLSERQRQDMVNVYRIAPSDKVQVLPLGFDLEPFLSLPFLKNGDQSREDKQSPLLIGFVGRLVDIKDPFLIFHALRLLESEFLENQINFGPIQLLIAGGGPLEEPLRIASQGLGTEVKFLGWQRDLPQLYSSLDIVILSSLNEGTPVVLIEAMASGKPFIATEVGGIPDLMLGIGQALCGRNGGQFTLYENGILVPSENAEALADALAYLASDPPKRVAMGKAGREFAKAQFNKERLLKDIRSLYRELLQARGLQQFPQSLLE